MGNSTFIELNNDFADELYKNREVLMKKIYHYLRTGDEVDYYTLGLNKMITFHREDKTYKKLYKLLNPKEETNYVRGLCPFCSRQVMVLNGRADCSCVGLSHLFKVKEAQPAKVLSKEDITGVIDKFFNEWEAPSQKVYSLLLAEAIHKEMKGER